MSNTSGFLGKFFEVAIKKQTYLNILYLLLSFPLGIFYFVFMTTSISLGVGLLVIVVGAFILSFVIWASKMLMKLERNMTGALLGMEYNEVEHSTIAGISAFRRFLLDIGDPENWKAVFYLLILKFPLGIINFTAAVTLLTTSLALIAAPMIFQILVSNFGDQVIIQYHGLQYFGFNLTPFEESIIFMFVGILLGVISLHIMNGLAYASGKILYFMSPVVKRSTLKNNSAM